ncbi:MAG: DNA polymerase III subunit alpha, partial [Acidimicrobiales bacterium]
RPGPMAANMHNDFADRKNGREKIEYLHPDLEEVLGDTYGLMIYQESMMRVAQKFAGYSLEEADNLRKACGKKIRALIAAEREKFVAGCERTGYGAALGTALFDIIEPFADYAFNKSHSYGYGLVAYQTAWLKANYPVQFLAAMLTSVKDDKDRTALYLADASAHDIDVMVPDINKSRSDFTVIDNGNKLAISFGLSAIRNVGESLVELVTDERDKNGPFHDFVEFCMRVDAAVLNKRAVESLIKAGAFDSLGHARKGLMHVYEAVINRCLEVRRDREQGVFSLFEEPSEQDELPSSADINIEISDVEWPQRELLAHEKEMLGLYVSSHPLRGFERALRATSERSIAMTKENAERLAKERDDIVLAGIATSVVKRYTKRGELMASFQLEDLDAQIEVFVFPKTMAEYGHLISEDQVYSVRGRLDLRDDQVKFVARGVEPIVLDAAPVNVDECVEISVPPVSASVNNLERLREILRDHPGGKRVLLQVGEERFELPPDCRIDPSGTLLGSLKEHFRDVIVTGA